MQLLLPRPVLELPVLQQLLPDILSEVPHVAKDLNAQDASNILWAGATPRKWMDLPSIAWAFAKLRVVNNDMMQAVVVALEGSVPGMKEWDLCVVVPDLAGRIVLYFCMLGTISAQL